MPFGLRRLRFFFERAFAEPKPVDYKTNWNWEAHRGAHEAILTGATAESFERTGQSDAELVAKYLRGGDVVLNIGCGVGRVEKYLAPRVRELHGIDISGEMIRRAGERLAGLANVRLREVGNREFLSGFPDGSMDLVFSFLVLQHLEREDAFLYLRDAHRVLKPGGRLLTQFPDLISPEYTRAFLDSAEAFPRSLGRVRAYTESEVRHLLATAGFEVTELWHGGHDPNRPAEIYVAATRASTPR
jgi:ubiquinone/menaquinone biosynthesis C-methylase UbiE